MPEMEIPAPKTPVYDVVAYLEGEKYPVKVRNHLVKVDAVKVLDHLAQNLVSVYWYSSNNAKNNKVVLDEADRWLKKQYVVSAHMEASTREVYIDDHIGHYSMGYTVHEPVYLEDLENEND